MDFARKQLEKYGWTDGKGLGKNENGIQQPLKPKLKRSVTGIGHDAAKDFTEHWWSQLYDKAAGNVQVEEVKGKTKKIKTKDNNFKITNSTYHIQNQADIDDKAAYGDFFIRTAILASDGSRTERVRQSDSESEGEKEQKDVFKMTDEELFAACEGRTAHKGARHGLRALGKLARIERQEQVLLNEDKYNGYSHTKRSKKDFIVDLQVEDMNLNSDSNTDNVKQNKKKKKHKHCKEVEYEDGYPDIAECKAVLLPESQCDDKRLYVANDEVISKKSKKSKRRKVEDIVEECEPKKKITKCDSNIVHNEVTEEVEVQKKVKRNKKKRKYNEQDLS